MTSGTHALILAQSAFEAVCKERDEIKTQADNLAKEFEASKAYAERCKQGGMSAIQPTPETDEAWAKWPYAGPGVHANFARKLERERDSAKTLNRTLLDQLEAKDAQLETMREAINAANVGLQSAMQYILNLPYFGNLEELETTEKVQAALAKLKPLLP